MNDKTDFLFTAEIDNDFMFLDRDKPYMYIFEKVKIDQRSRQTKPKRQHRPNQKGQDTLNDQSLFEFGTTWSEPRLIHFVSDPFSCFARGMGILLHMIFNFTNKFSL